MGSVGRTAVLTLLCGIGHVGSSVVFGAIGIAAGIAVGRLEGLEAFRGDIAAWLLFSFGIAYFVWGVWRAIRNRPHTHVHIHGCGDEHTHRHTHHDEHVHVHDGSKATAGDDVADYKVLTPWILFTIFVFGPCEPLIPLLMYPAAGSSAWGVAMVALVFAAATIGTMTAVVLVATFGLNLLPMRSLARYTHAIAGGSVALCGAAMLFLGL